MVLIRSSMCHEICLQGFVHKELTNFARSGLTMTVIRCSCALRSVFAAKVSRSNVVVN